MVVYLGDRLSDEDRESIKEKYFKLIKEFLEVRGKVYYFEKEIKVVQKEIFEVGCNILCFFCRDSVFYLNVVMLEIVMNSFEIIFGFQRNKIILFCLKDFYRVNI